MPDNRLPWLIGSIAVLQAVGLLAVIGLECPDRTLATGLAVLTILPSVAAPIPSILYATRGTLLPAVRMPDTGSERTEPDPPADMHETGHESEDTGREPCGTGVDMPIPAISEPAPSSDSTIILPPVSTPIPTVSQPAPMGVDEDPLIDLIPDLYAES